MNLGRFHAAVNFVVLELRDGKIIDLISVLEASLQNSISQQSEEAAKVFRESVSGLKKALLDAPSNNSHATQREIFNEIGASINIGSGLWSRIELSLTSNSMTPASALAKIISIKASVEKYLKTLDVVDDAFTELNIEFDSLESGDFEIGFSIPKIITTNKLDSLGKELLDVDYCVRSFSEVATGEGGSPSVSTISASNWQIFLESAPKVAACVAVALERIVNLYKTNLEIKQLKEKLEDKLLPEAVTAPLQNYIDGRVRDELRKIGDDIVDEYYKGDDGRRNELKNKLPKALRYLADRIDKGATVEVNAKLPKAPDVKAEDGDEETVKQLKREEFQKYEEVRKLAELVSDKMQAVDRLEIQDGPIFSISADQDQ